MRTAEGTEGFYVGRPILSLHTEILFGTTEHFAITLKSTTAIPHLPHSIITSTSHVIKAMDLQLTQNNNILCKKILLSVFVTYNLHLGLMNYRTSLEIGIISILINFEQLSFT